MLNKLKNKRGFNQIVTAMILLGVATVIALAVVNPFKGDGSTTGLPGVSADLVQQIQDDISSAAN